MTKTQIILVGFGDVGTKIFPTLMQINKDETNAGPGSLDISIVDIIPWNEMYEKIKPKLKDRFENYSEIKYNENTHLKFLQENYFQDEDPYGNLIPEGLINRIRPGRTIIYLALDPEIYYSVLEKYLPFGNIFALEKPLAKDSDTAIRLVHYAKQYEFLGKRFIPVDHYLGKYAVNLFDKISRTHKFSSIIEDSNLIIFSFLEKKISHPSQNPYFASTGIIADMMPHVSALLKKILKTDFEVKPKNVRCSVLSSYEKNCQTAHVPPAETYAEIELDITEKNRPPRTVVVRIGKGMPFEDRTVTFVDSVGDILLMKLPHTDIREGEVLLKDEAIWIKVDYEKPMPKKWDNSYYNIIIGLMDNKTMIDNKSSIFLNMEDAREIVEITKEIRDNAINMNKIEKYIDNKPPNYLSFDWINYSWESKTDYAVIFNFNGVLIDNKDINLEAWKWVLKQLRIEKYEDVFLSSLSSSGLQTKEILLYMLCKYYNKNLEGSIIETLASNWAKVKEQQYIADIIRKDANEMSGAKELLDALTSKQIKIGLYSIFPRRSVLQILHLIGVKQYFNVVVTPDLIRSDYKNQNTFIGCLNEVTARMGIEKQNCFLLEDSAGCVDMATEHGVKCIGFGMENRDELIKRGAICVVNDHTKLLDIFNNSQNFNEIVDKLKKI